LQLAVFRLWCSCFSVNHRRRQTYETGASALGNLAADPSNQDAIAAAGAIPALVQLLGSTNSAGVRTVAARALCNLASDHAQNSAVISDAGGIPALLQLLGPNMPADAQEAATSAVGNLVANLGARNSAAGMDAAGAIPALVQLLGV
jgi:vacuolar protein 8